MSDAILVSFILAFLAFGLDDLWLDLLAWFRGIGPRRIDEERWREIRTRPEKRIAILVAAWKEAGVIGAMLRGNLARLDYREVTFFVGAYPNDPDTLREVQAAARDRFRVRCVVNRRPGPTSKGQMLNECIAALRAHETREGRAFDAILIHDSEDSIHPASLRLINAELDRHDFIQIPVFSLPLSARELVSGTYLDEFAESHTKDIPVRAALGGPVPSAGTGTAIGRGLLDRLSDERSGEVFSPSSVTEDYELGMRAARLGSRSAFVCAYRDGDGPNARDYIATRAYFPRRMRRAARQKSRWTLGIVYQGTAALGWRGNLVENYFYYRDRRGVLCNVLALSGLIYVPAWMRWDGVIAWLRPEALHWALIGNLALMANRLLQRTRCCSRVYGARLAWLAWLRLPVGNVINAWAAISATGQFMASRLGRSQIRWLKTEHELPPELRALPAAPLIPPVPPIPAVPAFVAAAAATRAAESAPAERRGAA